MSKVIFDPILNRVRYFKEAINNYAIHDSKQLSGAVISGAVDSVEFTSHLANWLVTITGVCADSGTFGASEIFASHNTVSAVWTQYAIVGDPLTGITYDVVLDQGTQKMELLVYNNQGIDVDIDVTRIF